MRHETRAEIFDSVGTDWLGAIECHAPTGQIEALEISIAEFAGAQLISEIRRGRQRAAMPLDGAQPALRPRDEGQRRHQHQWKAVIKRAETRADQAHVVIQRQPTHEYIVGRDACCRTHGADIGQQIGMRQRHALGLTGAAGRVLQQRQIG